MTANPLPNPLPNDLIFFERGWLSSNTTLLLGSQPVVIDSGHHVHAQQLIELIQHSLGSQAPAHLINTHLHSDHCGGNHSIQSHWPGIDIFIPKSIYEATLVWDQHQLSFEATGQNCPRFGANIALSDGQELMLNGRTWQIHNAHGHDADSFVLFAPKERILLSADALWEHGFGVLFDELLSGNGFESQANTLQLINTLNPSWVLPGHGPIFCDVKRALDKAQARLEHWQKNPSQHSQHAAHVLLKFHLMVKGKVPIVDLLLWAHQVPLLKFIYQTQQEHDSFDGWIMQRLASLSDKKALDLKDGVVFNR